MGTNFACGGECGNTNHFQGSSGSPSISAAFARTGTNSILIAAAAAAKYVRARPVATTATSVRFYIYFDSLPGADVAQLLRLDNSGSTNAVLGFEASSGKLRARIDVNAGWKLGSVINADTWYRIDMVYNVVANPHTMSWQIDGVDQTGDSGSVAATTALDVYIGTTLTSDTFAAYYDDILIADSSAEYPLGAGTVDAVGLVSDGTHSFNAAGDFKYENSGNVATSATDVYTHLDEIPGSDSEWIAGVTVTAGEYVECVFAAGATTAPSHVELILNHHTTSTATNTWEFAFRDHAGATEDIARAAGVANVTSSAMARSSYPTIPGGGAWTLTARNALRFRLRQSGADSTPVGGWDSAFLEVATPAIVVGFAYNQAVMVGV